ncbi:hypothetical protein E2C01_085780 [Portunus trituberculatus]|uniref:Uncharacterized protein n=1 Tax=Portunus trituberculatus TaxID=210409 RepID=A0A5B7J1X4_PORTR|nr:hypothetical protein [Portunus trituberculatus]
MKIPLKTAITPITTIKTLENPNNFNYKPKNTLENPNNFTYTLSNNQNHTNTAQYNTKQQNTTQHSMAPGTGGVRAVGVQRLPCAVR